MVIDLKSLNHHQLDELIKRAEQRKAEIAKEKLAKAREKIHALLESEELTLEEVFGSGRKARRAAAAKYRNPADHAQTWTGHGKRPKWFLAALKSGKKERDLLIR